VAVRLKVKISLLSGYFHTIINSRSQVVDRLRHGIFNYEKMMMDGFFLQKTSCDD
jgi:hypothetical protein